MYTDVWVKRVKIIFLLTFRYMDWNICVYILFIYSKFLSVFFSLFPGVRPVFFDQWRKIDQFEQKRGNERGKPREKIVHVHEMLNIAYELENKGS